MNFLAHAYLSGQDEKLLAGNFFADFIKGKQALTEIDREIARGIALHRHIDAFTDTHEVVQESKNRLRPKYRHYSAVIVDVFYDHFLAVQWAKYHNQPLLQYTQSVYNSINKHIERAPQEFAYMFRYMRSGNWLYNYKNVEGIARSLTGMAQRTPYESKMDEAVGDLLQSYDYFHTEFDRFFPALKASCEQWLVAHPVDNANS